MKNRLQNIIILVKDIFEQPFCCKTHSRRRRYFLIYLAPSRIPATHCWTSSFQQAVFSGYYALCTYCSYCWNVYVIRWIRV